VLAFDPNGNLFTVDTSDPSLPATLRLVVPTPNLHNSESASVAYSPLITPYIYLGYSNFFAGTSTTTNKLFVIDPRTSPWSVVTQIDLSTSAQTLRGFALDSHGNLFFSQFSGSGSIPAIQEIANASNPAGLTDNSSVVVYSAGSQVFIANFAYLDVAQGVGGSTNTCYANCDHSTTLPFLNVNDFICFQSLFASGDPAANCDGSTTPPVLNVNDFICFQSSFAAGCSAP
jgi:hypothetical protein